MATYHHIAPISAPLPVPVTALCFDPVSDIIWAGSNTGGVTALAGRQGLRTVAFRVGDLPLSKIVAGESYVRAGCSRGMGLGTWGKGGTNKWFYQSERGVMTFTSSTTSSNVIGVSVVGPELLLVSPATGTVVRQCQVPSLITHLEFSHSSLISAGADGYLRTHDPRTGITRAGGSDSSVRAHPSGIQGLQISGNFVFTIGLQSRQGRPFPDHLVKVFDLRSMRALPPVPFSAGPAFLNLVPRRSSTIAVTSTQGSVTIVDAANPNVTQEFYQIDTASYLTSVALSPTGAYMAFGDADGLISILTQVEDDNSLPFNGFEGQPFEWPDAPPPLPEIDWNDATPLNSIGMPYYKSLLLSSWSPSFSSSTPYFPPPQKIPLQILNTMKMNDNVAYATLPKELRGKRNVVAASQRKPDARFRSGKAKATDESETLMFDSGEDIPKMYRRVEIEYSKFGVEDFDFAFYNKTEYSGLETHILNSYTNPIIQAMHYSRPVSLLAKSHIATDCNREHCLLCELGFVVRMLEDARGINCQASNFCKTVGVLAQTSNNIDLIDYGRESNEVDHSHVIQSFHRFLIDHLSAEGNAFPRNPLLLKAPDYVPDPYNPAAAPITQLMGIDAKNIITCVNCKAVRMKENVTHIVDLIYPRKAISNEIQPPTDFSSILRDSLLRQMTHKATCQSCKQFATFSSRRSIASKELPPILALNTCLNTDENLKLWMDKKGQTFLQPRVELQGQVEGIDDLERVLYELRDIIVEIITEDEHSHLVAIVKVPEAEQKQLGSPWYLFNDFVVRNISEEEALSFPNKWKVPAVLHFERVDLRDALDFSEFPTTLDPTLLSKDTSISMSRDPSLVKHEPLRYDELPRPGTLVAIDAEFVLMQQEETEFKSDGTKKVIRPSRLSLARVSVLRGDGPKQALPFIDDHIHTSELIVDYLTEFSGIRFGDLDLLQSPYTLTPLKVVYKKLRILVDRGCIFIGHGLSKDFRIINIFVPPEQVIDTVDLYFVKSRQRRLSLRFLSWFVLGQHIQTDTHDSIEDARSALNLYKRYHEFEEQGIFDAKLDELYKEGRQYNFKPPPPPEAAPAVPSPMAADPYSIGMLDASFAQMFSASPPHPPPRQAPIGMMASFMSAPNITAQNLHSHSGRSRGHEERSIWPNSHYRAGPSRSFQ